MALGETQRGAVPRTSLKCPCSILRRVGPNIAAAKTVSLYPDMRGPLPDATSTEIQPPRLALVQV